MEKLIKNGNISAAQSLLDGVNERNAEWHYLQSVIFYKKNWISESEKQLKIHSKGKALVFPFFYATKPFKKYPKNSKWHLGVCLSDIKSVRYPYMILEIISRIFLIAAQVIPQRIISFVLLNPLYFLNYYTFVIISLHISTINTCLMFFINDILLYNAVII